MDGELTEELLMDGERVAKPVNADPIKQIQELIHKAHVTLTQEVDALMVKHENEIRLQIKSILAKHANGIDDVPTPLDNLR